MKVLVVHNAYQSHHIGGEDVIVQREIAGLKAILGDEKVFEYIVSNDEIRPLKLAMNIWGDRLHYEIVADIVHENTIDIVHVHNFFPLLTPSVFSAAKSAGAKVVHTLHNFRNQCLSGIFYRNKVGTCEECVGKKWGWPAVKHGCYRNSHAQSLVGSLSYAWYRHQDYENNIDAFFVLSHFQREKYKTYLPLEKMHLKPNPIQPPLDRLNASDKRDFLYVGRLEEAKGILLLLSVWKLLPESFHLNIIGTGNDELVSTFHLPNIRFLGKYPHERVLEEINKAKYVIHPSLTYETFGLTMVEALAQGTPVIGIARGTRPEFITDEKNGFLCEENTLKEVIIKAFHYSDSNYEMLCQHAFESAKQFYTPLVMKEQMALYQQILAS